MTFSVIKLQAPFEKIKDSNKSSEIALRRAIILQAIIDASNTSNSKGARRMEQDAKKWLFDNSKYFANICLEADLDPGFVASIAKKVIKLHNDKLHNGEKSEVIDKAIKEILYD